jgi:hypothetical protein
MTASANNGFGQIKYAPAPSKECKNIPYDFHPMYSTSSEKTRVPWTAHSYNIAFSDEIGHFDYCVGAAVPSSQNGVSCPKGNQEGASKDREGTDSDDNFCFPASQSSDARIQGCVDSNLGMDGPSYLRDWPDGNRLHPTPIIITSPLTGKNYSDNYSRTAFEGDMPAFEPTCSIITGKGCTRVPITDDGAPAKFYPFYTTSGKASNGHCIWTFGNDIPGVTRQDFGKDNQYGSLLGLSYTTPGGGSETLFTDFRHVLSHNPCPA